MRQRRTILARIIIPLVLVLLWFGAAAVGGPYFGKISEVATNDLTTFLPESAESTKVAERLNEFVEDDSLPALVVIEAKSGELSLSDQESLASVVSSIEEITGVNGEVSPPILAEDKKASLIAVPLDSGAEFGELFESIREELDSLNIAATYSIGGPASYTYDLQRAFEGIDVTLLAVALSLVFVILIVVYRSPVLPFAVLFTSVAALCAAIVAVWHMADAGWIELNSQVQGILFILVIGAATDYSLLYVARLREEYAHHADKFEASKAAWRGSFEPIVAAGGTVIVGLMCLLLSDLGSNKALGPVGGTGIVLSMLSALTFLPAALLLLGKKAFWPLTPQLHEGKKEAYSKQHPLWAKVGSVVRKYPRRLWVGSTALLLIASLGFFQLKADGVSQSDLVLGKSEARDSQKVIEKHFPSGSGNPTNIIVSEADISKTVEILDQLTEVESVSAVASDSPSGSKPLGKAALEIEESFAAGPNPFTNIQPKVANGDVLIQATLTSDPTTQTARLAIQTIRDEMELNNITAKVGGATAAQYDTNRASLRDQMVIIPVILLAITIILALLLRSLVAPLFLLATTVLSFGATLGISALLFNHVWSFPGADPSVVLFGFVFLVALGIDYNIFLMSRVREETFKHGVAKGTVKGLVVTGGVITSAGVVLAATFAALGVIPILFLVQLAFVVAFGVLLDTLLVRSILVPALTLEIGPRMWWPKKPKK